MECPACHEALTGEADRCPGCGWVADLAQGALVGGRYAIVSKLGEGGMAKVYLAEDVASGATVALKVLSPTLGADPSVRARFEREAEAAGRVAHPNVVTVYAQGEHRGQRYMAMKHIDGETLTQRHRRLPLSPAELRGVVRQLAAGLGAIHAAGFVHRDIKGGNLMLTREGQLTILDLGILRDAGGPQLTLPGQVLGTPKYLAPEQVLGREVDGRADQYAAAVMLFELVTGKPAFAGSMEQLILSHLNQPAPDACAVAPGVPSAVGQALQRAMAKQPDERYPDIAAFAEAFEAGWQQPGPAEARTELAVALPDALPAPAPPRPATPARPTRPPSRPPASAPAPKRSRAGLVGAGLLGVGLIALLAGGLGRQRHAEAEARAGAAPAGPGKLSITPLRAGKPVFASVSVDGVQQGNAPVVLEESSGPHRIHLERSDAPPVDREVTVQSGAVAVLNVELGP